MKLSITDMKRLNEAANQKWFSVGAMQFFNTRIVAQSNVANIFITSEHDGHGSPDKYTLRWFNIANGHVETLGDFQDYKTLDDARQARKEITKEAKRRGITPYEYTESLEVGL